MSAMRRFLLALAVACLVGALGVVVMKVADLPDAWSWAVLLIAMFVGSLCDREGFYGTPPRSRH